MNSVSSVNFDEIFHYTLKMSGDDADTVSRIRHLRGGIFGGDRVLSNRLRTMKPIDLSHLLQVVFAKMTLAGEEDAIAVLDRLSQILPYDKLQEAQAVDALKEARKMFEQAKVYLRATQGPAPATLQRHFMAVLEALTGVLQAFIMMFGINGFSKVSDNEMLEQHHTYKLLNCLQIMVWLTVAFGNALGAAVKWTIVGLGVFIAALSLVWSSIKPMPHALPANAENWTREAMTKGCTVEGRRESLDQMAKILTMNRHVMLVGPSRVGKSVTAKAFAAAVAGGEYPALTGKQVFYINTTSLIGQQAHLLGGSSNILNRISEIMGRHRKDIILVLDEVQMACKNHEKIADQLKTFLDEGGEFPHVIGITTDKDYEACVKDNVAFALRFDRVDIASMGRDETLTVLGGEFLRSHPHPIMAPHALEDIYDKSQQIATMPQPAAAVKLLKQCINGTEKTQQSPTEQRMLAVANKIARLRAVAVVTNGSPNEEIVALEHELALLKVAFSHENEETEKLFHAQDALDKVTAETYATVAKVAGVAERRYDTKMLSRFVLLREYLGPILEHYVREKAQTLGLNVVVDKSLIDAVSLV